MKTEYHLLLRNDVRFSSESTIGVFQREDEVRVGTLHCRIETGTPARLWVSGYETEAEIPGEPRFIDKDGWEAIFWTLVVEKVAQMYNIALANVDFVDNEQSQIVKPSVRLMAEFFKLRSCPNTYSRGDWQFLANQYLTADPNLVPYREEWTDNLGGMANAIFWMAENWRNNLNAQGERMGPEGSLELWNYSPATGILIHHTRSGICYEVQADKLYKIVKGDRENATIYRPYYRIDLSGQVEWLKTREIVVQKHSHLDRTPVTLSAAFHNLSQLMGKGCLAQFPSINLQGLIPHGRKGALMRPELLAPYGALVDQLQTVRSVRVEFQPLHIHSYWALSDALIGFFGFLRAEETHVWFGLDMALSVLIDLHIGERDIEAASILHCIRYKKPYVQSELQITELLDKDHPIKLRMTNTGVKID